MRIAIGIALAFAIATGAGTYAYLGGKLDGLSVKSAPASERGWHMGATVTDEEIVLAPKAG